VDLLEDSLSGEVYPMVKFSEKNNKDYNER